MMNYTANEILAARERRADLIYELLKRYQLPLLVMRVNYPGLEKMNKVTAGIMEDMVPLLCVAYSGKVYSKRLLCGAEGPVLYVAVREEVRALKTFAVQWEETQILGRCLDLDVYAPAGKSISRQELGYPKRTCYLCEDVAHHCVRARRHSEREVIGYIEKKFQEHRGKLKGRG